MRLKDYQALSGDLKVNDAALWLEAGVTPEEVIASLRLFPFGQALEFAEPGQIRALSLNIFDRSFAVTYLLEAVAIIIGLLGVASSFSAQALARRKEFGALRHIGVTQRQILGMLAVEGANPQSFHWTMQLALPWKALTAVAVALLLSAALTAVASGRHSVSGNAIRAVREDW
jgi:putative ABC transport system permease protein